MLHGILFREGFAKQVTFDWKYTWNEGVSPVAIERIELQVEGRIMAGN